MLKSYRIVMNGVLAVGCAVTLQAQTPTATNTHRPTAGEMTLTGCVERADELGGNGTAAATVDSLSFVLIHASKGTAAEAPAPTGTSGTSDTRPTPKGSIYRLDGAVAALNPHVGHKVEVSGTLEAASAAGADPSDSQSAANAPRIKVSGVKMLSETCAR